MIRIKALNEEEESDSEEDETHIDTKEALEEKALSLYNEALQYLRENNLKEAETIFLELLESSFLSEVVRPTDSKGLNQSPVLLKYSCLKNLGSVLVKQNNLERALDYYKQALELDDSDVTLWFKVGTVALKVLNYELACVAFQEGLRCSPNHWPCLDQLITVLYVLNDYISCLHYIAKGLKADPDFLKGIAFREKIINEQPTIVRDYSLFFPNDSSAKEWKSCKTPEDFQDEANAIIEEALELREVRRKANKEISERKRPTVYAPVPLSTSNPSWISLGRTIFSIYRFISSSPDPNVAFSCTISFSSSEHSSNPPLVKTVSEDKEGNGGDQKTEECSVDENKDCHILLQDEEMSELSDGEKPMDQDEGPSDLPNAVQPTAGKRGPKRRRSPSFVEEWMWAGKRRSARVRGTARRETERDEPSLREALRRLIPSSLMLDNVGTEENQLKSKQVKENFLHLIDDSMDTMDIYKLFEGRVEGETETEDKVTSRGNDEDAKCNGKEEIEDSYFDTQKEKDDVKKFVENCRLSEGILPILRSYMIKLVNMEKLKWPQSLVTVYLECYQGMRVHFPHPNCCNPDEDPVWIFTSARISLLYAELFMRRYFEVRGSRSHTNPSVDPSQILAEDLAMVSFVASSEWPDEMGCNLKFDISKIKVDDDSQDVIKTKPVLVEMFLRLHWLDCHLFLNDGNISSAIHSLKIVLMNLKSNSDMAEKDEDFGLKLVNSKYNQNINKAVTKKLLLTLERNLSLEKVKDLFEDGQFSEVADILETTFHLFSQHQQSKGNQQPWIPNQLNLGEGSIPDRPAQLAMFLDALWEMKDYSRYFLWGEACCNEAFTKYMNVEDESEQQKWANTLVKLFSGLESCINKAGLSVMDGLSSNKMGRLAHTVSQVVCHQMTVDNLYELPIESITPWILLHHIISHFEHSKGFNIAAYDAETERSMPAFEEIPASISILFTAHEYLGRRSWCCLNEGALLFHILDVVVPKLRSPALAPFRDFLNQNLEQVLFCLYSHPSKKTKARYLQEHGVPPIPLTWERAMQVFECLKPDSLPEFDSYQVGSISVEVEQLFRRITALVPPECDTCNYSQLLEKMSDYINGERKILPTREGESVSFPKAVSSIYYLLGDYYFKNNEWDKAIKNYLLDVCINPLRLDSWAGMALAKGSQLETKLNSCEVLKSESEFLSKASATHRCYRRAVELDYTHSLVWIEYGSFVYMIHSFCSRLLKQETHSLSLEMFEFLEKEKEEMLDQAYKCFTTANQIWYRYGVEHGLQDERWLHHYMLGKISEKRGEDPSIYLDHYCKAADFLYNCNANYPRKISYSNPPDYSMESLEVHYRIHASILKWLEQHEDKPLSKELRNVFSKHISTASQSPFAKFKTKASLSVVNPTTAESENGIVGQTGKEGEAVISEKGSNKRQASDMADDGDEKNAQPVEKKPCKLDPDTSLMQDVIDVMDSVIGKVVDLTKEQDKDIAREDKTPEKVISSIEEVKQQKLEVQPEQTEVKLVSEEEPVSTLVVPKIAELRRSSQESNVSGEANSGVEANDEEENAPANNGSSAAASSSSSDSSSSSSSSSSDSSSSSSSDSSSSSSESDSDDDSSNTASSKVISTDPKPKTVEIMKEAEKDAPVLAQNGTAKTEEKKNEPLKQEEAKPEPVFESKDHFDLIQRCLSALEECVNRFSQHYKSVYRITHFYFRSKKHRNVKYCRDLLLGPTNNSFGLDGQFGSGSTSPSHTPPGRRSLPGLFADRKNNNFFNGVWRIPVTEIDRPGSFASHMSRCVLLLMEVLRELKDHAMLLELCIQLQKTPESDKKYLRDTEREQLSQEALTLAVQSIRNLLKTFPANQVQKEEFGAYSPSKEVEFLIAVFRSYNKVQKHLPQKESIFSQLLVDVYKVVGKKKLDASSPTAQIDQVVKFCQQEMQLSRAAAAAAASAAVATATAMNNVASALPGSCGVTPITAPQLYNVQNSLPLQHHSPGSIPSVPKKQMSVGVAKTSGNISGISTPTGRQGSLRGRGSGNSSRGSKHSQYPSGQPKVKNVGLSRSNSTPLNVLPPTPPQQPFLPPAITPAMQSIFTDPSLLTAAVQAHLPTMDTLLDLQAQYSGIRDQIIRQMATVAAAAAAAVSSTPQAPPAHSTRGSYRGRGRGLSRTHSVPSSMNAPSPQNLNLMPPYQSTSTTNVQKAMKDRPNISITPITSTGQTMAQQNIYQAPPPPLKINPGGYKPPLNRPTPPPNRSTQPSSRQTPPIGRGMPVNRQTPPMNRGSPTMNKPTPPINRASVSPSRPMPPMNRPPVPLNRPTPVNRQMSPVGRPPINKPTPPMSKQQMSPISKQPSPQLKQTVPPLNRQMPQVSRQTMPLSRHPSPMNRSGSSGSNITPSHSPSPHLQQLPPPLPPPPPCQPSSQQGQIARKPSQNPKDPYKKTSAAYRKDSSNLSNVSNPATMNIPNASSLGAGVAATLARLPSTQLEIIPAGVSSANTVGNITPRNAPTVSSSPLLPSLTLPSSITITAKQSSSNFSRPCNIGKKDTLTPTENPSRQFDEKPQKEAKPGKGVEVITIE